MVAMGGREPLVGGDEIPKKVLLATDGSSHATLAVCRTVAISKGTEAELHLVHVWHEIPSPHYDSFIQHELEALGREILTDAVRYVEGVGGRVAGSHLAVGRSVEGILEFRENIGADVIVVGSRGLGAVRSVIMGSVSMELARRAPCPILVVHGEVYGKEKASPTRQETEISEMSAR